MRKVQTLAMDDGWRLVNLLFTEKHMDEHPVKADLEYKGGRVSARHLQSDRVNDPNFIVYFVPPKEYLGNRITSYGGILRYKVFNTIDTSKDTTGSAAADIVLSGNNITIIHEHIEQPAIGEEFEFTAKFVEQEFRHLNGHEVTREKFMMVLVNLDAIYIRGIYFKPNLEISLENVLLDTAIESRRVADAPRALSVEQCNCSPNYKGTSCEVFINISFVSFNVL